MGQKKPDKNELLSDEYLEYTKAVVSQIARKLNLHMEEFDEYQSAGYFGLVEAAGRYDPASGVSFKSYAWLRIRGAVLDWIRSSGKLPRNAYRLLKTLEQAQDLREELGTQQDLVKGDATDRLAAIMDYAASSTMLYHLSTEEASAEINNIESGPETRPDFNLEQNENHLLLSKLLRKLSKRDREIIHAVTIEDVTLSEIGQRYGRTKSWACKRYSICVEKLKTSYLELSRE